MIPLRRPPTEPRPPLKVLLIKLCYLHRLTMLILRLLLPLILPQALFSTAPRLHLPGLQLLQLLAHLLEFHHQSYFGFLVILDYLVG